MTPVSPNDPIRAEAFTAVYEAHAEAVFRTAHQVLRDPGHAEDVTQEVFIAHWRSPGRFDPARGELGTYLRMMARSRALDALRSAGAARRARERLEHAMSGDHATVEDPPVLVTRSAERADLRAAVASLPRPQRDALALSYWGELSTSEIARRAQIPHGTVKSRVRLGLRKLRERVRDEPPLAA